MLNPLTTLKSEVDQYDIMDTFDRVELRERLLLLNTHSREAMELYRYAQEKGIV